MGKRRNRIGQRQGFGTAKPRRGTRARPAPVAPTRIAQACATCGCTYTVAGPADRVLTNLACPVCRTPA